MKKKSRRTTFRIEFRKWSKILFVNFVLITLSCTYVIAQEKSSEEKRITATYSDKTILEVLEDLKVKTGYTFVHKQNDISNDVKITETFQHATLDEVLEKVLTVHGYDYSIEGKVIVIKKKAKMQQTPIQEMITVRGRVTDENGNPLPGVSVVIKGTTIGVSSNHNGEYSIALPKGKHTVVFSMIGMEGQEIVVDRQREINVIMREVINTMDEVVVTGIFSRARESYTGAANMVTSKELAISGNRSILSMLRNLDPSFNLSQSLNFGSDPNHLPSITIRGMSSLSAEVRSVTEESSNLREANQPLFILDGFEISLEQFMDIDEANIATITLLKDAGATAIYGSRGSNGVVVITTKDPEPGKLRLSYTLNLKAEMPDLSSYNLMDAYEKLEFEQAAGVYIASKPGDQPRYDEIYNRRRMDAERGVNTYWLKYPVRSGITANHSVSISGGDQSFRYSARVSYNLDKGVMKGSERGTFNGNLLFSYSFKKFSFRNNISISTTKGSNSPYGNFSQYGVLNSYWKPYDEQGKLIKMLEDGNDLNREKVMNPLYDASLQQKDENKSTIINNNLAVEYNPIPGLRVSGRFNVTSMQKRGDRYLSAEHSTFANYLEDQYDEKGSYTYSPGESISYQGDITVQYNQTFGKHMVSAGISYNISSSKEENYSVTGVGLTVPNANYFGMANQYAPGRPTSSDSKRRRIGGVMSLNYTYDHRYFIDGSATVEGSSQFGTDRNMAPFWSVGMGWNVHHEKFLSTQEVLSALRLRMSYGNTGSQGFESYQAATTYKSFEGKGYNRFYGVSLMGLGNPELGWQKTQQWNFGFEIAFIENRFRFNFDVYNKVTNNLLTDIYLPTASGFESYKANVGKVSNRGYEVTLNCSVFKSADPAGLFLTVGTSAIHNVNKVQKISNSIAFLNDQILKEAGVNPSFMYKEGESMNAIYAVKSLGIDPSNGKELFVKQDGSLTYTWDANDQVVCGNTDPLLSGNLNVNLTYRYFTLNAIFGYSFGGQNYNYTLVGKVENVDPIKNADRRVLYDRWREPGDEASFQGIANRTTTKATSRFVMDDNVFELRNVSLSYNFPSDWIRKNMGISSLSLSANTEDLFHISTIKQERGLAYPFSRKFSFSLTATF